jgi:16S rRNA (cytosine1402-N4)-methyltransferase
MSHIPVLLEEVCEYAKEIKLKDVWFLDGTFGRGGHARAIMELRPDLKYLALDQDAEAVEYGKKEFASYIEKGQMEIHCANYSRFNEFIQNKKLGGVLLDLGVSSPQLDVSERGFSFYKPGPLDMRMDQSQIDTAATIINNWSEDDLCELFKSLGEIHSPYKVVKNIVKRRKTQEFNSTQDLSDFIVRTEGWRKKGHHPATQYFMALRLHVNQELAVLENTLSPLAGALSDWGRLLVITFHSLEDRIVKNAVTDFVDKNWGQKVTNKVITPSREEEKLNPRARSAKLRVWQKGIDEDLKTKNEKKRTAEYLKKND